MSGFLKKQQLKHSFLPNCLSVLINPFYLARKGMPSKISQYGKDFSGKLLDFGCGYKPYKALFPNVQEYIGVDFENEGHDHSKEDIDVFYNGKEIPFPENTFDCAISTEVLEHVVDIDMTLEEISRVMKKDAQLIVTVPFVWMEHELPYDFRRYTTQGLITKLESHGFEVNDSYKNGDFIKVVFQLKILYLYRLFFTKNKLANLFINLILAFPLTVLGMFFSFIFPTNKNLYFNTILLATKK